MNYKKNEDWLDKVLTDTIVRGLIVGSVITLIALAVIHVIIKWIN